MPPTAAKKRKKGFSETPRTPAGRLPPCTPEWLLFLYETLGVATIGGDLVYDGTARDEQQVFEAFTKFTCFAVAHEYRLAEFEWYGSHVSAGGWNLTRSFERTEPGTHRQVRPGPVSGA